MLEKRREREIVPNYSLTGDLLSFLRCGLQYRYQNGSALPPSRPVQMWFGEFIHGIMETAYRTWLASKPPFPWPCNQTPFNKAPPIGRAPHDIGSIGDLVEASLEAAGKNPRSTDLRNSGYARAKRAVNEVGPELFPLIRSAEEKVIGTRPMPTVAGVSQRANMYELHGVMDVLSSVSVNGTPNSVICQAVRQAVQGLANNVEVIVDYKGSRRPPTTHKYWDQGDWQLQMYAWLRSRQPSAVPVAAGVLLYINELEPGAGDVSKLRHEVDNHETDVIPTKGSPDDYQLRTWRSGGGPPAFSQAFRMARMIRVVPITPNSTTLALGHFDSVVTDIEACVAREAQAGKIIAHWKACGDDETCSACDFRHFCPSPAGASPGYTPKPPKAPG